MYREDSIQRWFVKKQTSLAVEHKVKETSEKSGETSVFLETKKHVVTHEAAVETFLEVFTELRERDREKTISFMFNASQDGFYILTGADVTSVPQILEDNLRECNQAFHHRS